MRLPSRSLPLSFACMLALLAALPAAAQDTAPPAAPVVVGTVTDKGTGQPLASAQVEVAGTRVRALTDADGRFTLRGLTPGTHRATVSRVGYRALNQEWQVAGDTLAVSVALEAAPVQLEGIAVQVNRFERRLASRRRAAGVSTRAFGRERIERTVSPHAWDFVRYHSGVFLIACTNGRLECTRRRGRTVRVSVMIDERPAFGGLTELYNIPRDELHLVEVYDRTLIRVYTRRFVERAAAENWIPM